MSYSIVDRLLDVVLSPGLWLSVALVFVYSGLFTLWRGGGIRQFPRDFAAGLSGFALGQLVAMLAHIDLLRVGEVRLLGGTVVAVLALLLARRYWRFRQKPAAPPAPGGART